MTPPPPTLPLTVDEAAVRAALPSLDVLGTLRSMFASLAATRAVQPPQTLTLFPDQAGDFITYLGALADAQVFGAKLSPYVVTGGKPIVTAWTALMSMRTGQPLMWCDAGLLTVERTAGTTALAVDCLAPRAARPAPPAGPTPWGPLFRRMAPTIFVYFCYGWTAWLFFTWLPTFFLNGQGLNLKSTALFASGVFFAGVVGDTLGGWLCDRVYRKTGNLALSRQSVIVASFVGALVCLLPLAVVHSTAGVALCLSGSFLCLELTIGPIWAVPSDIAPTHAGIASGMMNAGSAISGILSPILFGYLVDRTGSWTVPFMGSVAMLLIGIVAALRIRPDRSLAESMPALVDAPAAPSH
ncbi:MFS transporter [Burkholderia sp. Se-20373]|uniref:MFS transporter n=1 Tax=Burkholderia sp. Se-20373 TaxID=2703898 RepID=UPI001F120781|nr:MFS transporter [Burkholderia sp. Se-20373]MBN3743970.1 MFS transporter [Burkholderia sp. Se-20373]